MTSMMRLHAWTQRSPRHYALALLIVTAPMLALMLIALAHMAGAFQIGPPCGEVPLCALAEPWRTPTTSDWVWDVCGLLLPALLAARWLTWLGPAPRVAPLTPHVAAAPLTEDDPQ